MKIIYLATSQIAVEVLHELNKYHEIAAVVTRPDKPQGRSKKMVPSPIAAAAEKLNLKVFKPMKIDAELINILKSLGAFLFVTFSYGVILKEDFFSITGFGGINIHPSLLPKLRGPSPIKSAILNGENKSGLTIQKISLKIDSGDIICQKEFDILDEDDLYTIEDKVANLASKMIIEALENIKNNDFTLIKQDNTAATYCKLIKKEDGLINWEKNAKTIINKIKAFNRWPIAFSFLDGERINIYKAGINKEINNKDFKDKDIGEIILTDKKNGIVVKALDSFVNIYELQKKGKKVLDWKSFMNGYKNLLNKKFTDGAVMS